MAIILLITTEDGQTTELPVLDKIRIGRSSSSDYKISDSKMSGIHCSFEVNPQGQLHFKDLDSTNGSFLNNSKVQQTIIHINDVIRVGNTLITLDESKLNSRERLALGSSANKKYDKTLPEINRDLTKVIQEKLPKKKAIVLNKGLKDKKPQSNWSGGSDNIIEQEASSGFTKMLKLNNKKKK